MSIVKKINTGISVLKNEGLASFVRLFQKSVQIKLQKKQLSLLVRNEDVLGVRISSTEINTRGNTHTGSKNIAWIMSPPGETSGGHQNLFRFINFAEKAGYTNTIFIYSNDDFSKGVGSIQKMLSSSDSYPPVAAKLQKLERGETLTGDFCAAFATGWETAYPLKLSQIKGEKLYFVQDFEPLFYPSGSESLLAENTYRFGFKCITAGKWLSHKLASEYGLWTRSFDFGVEHDKYFVKNRTFRNEILFYARPVTPRRGFELGILALTKFAEQNPEITINLAGWDTSDWDIPFSYNNLGGLPVSELNSVYNKCAAALVLSTTNMSLLPLELLASGVSPVVNDAPNNRMVTDNPFIQFVEPTPTAIAEQLSRNFNPDLQLQLLSDIENNIKNYTWETSGEQFINALESALNG